LDTRNQIAIPSEIWDVIAEMLLYADGMVVFLSPAEKDLVIPAGI
jgi:hypothetical protein